MYVLFIISTIFFIKDGINPLSSNKIHIVFYPTDFFVGFLLYFVTAIDYALIIGRMQTANPGNKARLIMNVFTCLGCFVGVTLILFLWGFAKEVSLIILPLLIFAGAVMVKLAYEGRSYYQQSPKINNIVKNLTTATLNVLYYPTRVFSFWLPELGSPNVQKMTIAHLAKWSFLLPFIIGLDDFIGYMGAMTLYNTFSLIAGIYFADIVIDILIFFSPKFTSKMVESPYLSLFASYAFLYLAYKSFSEAYILVTDKLNIRSSKIVVGVAIFILVVLLFDYAAIFYRQKFKDFLKILK